MVVQTALPVQTDVSNYFVSNYPPYSQWTAEQVPIWERRVREYRSSDPLGLYVHIPFCRQRCSYCYFRVLTRASEQQVDQYVDNLLDELDLYQRWPSVAGRPVANAYFGGGTPTHLSSRQLERLLSGLRQRLAWDAADERTYECQPGTVDLEKLRLLREHGITRLSLGVQTFTESVLRAVGRAATAQEAVRDVLAAREAGFPELNIDLIAGLPGESDDSWDRTLRTALELAPDGVTVYQFELTHNSGLFKQLQAGRSLQLPDWPTKRQWVERAFEAFEASGYTVCGAYWIVRDPQKYRYAYVTEHYWRGEDLLALGVSAFGLFDGVHYQNVDQFAPYQQALAEGRLPAQRAYRMDSGERLRREFILQLKTGHVDLDRLRARFGDERLDELSGALAQLREAGWLDDDQQAVRLTRAGLLRVDWLLPAFYRPQHQGVRYT